MIFVPFCSNNWEDLLYFNLPFCVADVAHISVRF